MAKVSVTKRINAPVERVWEMVSEWGGTHKWIPGVGPVTVEGKGVGSTRSAELDPATGFPGRITERLDVFDVELRCFRYCTVGESPLPVRDYVAEMRVEQVDAAHCDVTWSSTWVATNLPEAEIAGLFEGLYNSALENVEKALS